MRLALMVGLWATIANAGTICTYDVEMATSPVLFAASLSVTMSTRMPVSFSNSRLTRRAYESSMLE